MGARTLRERWRYQTEEEGARYDDDDDDDDPGGACWMYCGGNAQFQVSRAAYTNTYKYNGFKIIKLLERTRRWLHSESTLVSRYQILVIDYDN